MSSLFVEGWRLSHCFQFLVLFSLGQAGPEGREEGFVNTYWLSFDGTAMAFSLGWVCSLIRVSFSHAYGSRERIAKNDILPPTC